MKDLINLRQLSEQLPIPLPQSKDGAHKFIRRHIELFDPIIFNSGRGKRYYFSKQKIKVAIDTLLNK